VETLSSTAAALAADPARAKPVRNLAIPGWLYSLALPLVLIGAWQLATGGRSYSLIPPPSTVVLTAWDYAFGGIRNDTYSGTFAANAMASITRVFGGFSRGDGDRDSARAHPRAQQARAAFDRSDAAVLAADPGHGVAAADDDSVRPRAAGDDRADRARDVLSRCCSIRWTAFGWSNRG
jgi:hypothetical protein